jgi:hypothetical protein
VVNQRRQLPTTDRMVAQVADLVEALMVVPMEDREGKDLEEVDLEEVDLEEVGLEEVHVHPVRDLEQVVQACGVE